MDRRTFIGTALGGLFVEARPADAQTSARVHRIGFVGGLAPTAPEAAHLFRALFEALRELGYVEGRNMVFEGRYYGFRTERLPALLAELVAAKVDVIVTGAAPAPEAAHRATSTIPIVMTSHPDPVAAGLAVSLAKPRKNLTGLSIQISEIPAKRLQIIKEAVPRITRVAVLLDPVVPSAVAELRQIEAAARTLGLELRVKEVRSPAEFSSAFETMAKERIEAVVSIGGNTLFSNRTHLIELAAKRRLPSIFGTRQFADDGALMSYGPNIAANWRRAASYVDKILKGAKPGELPIEQAAN
ncbi:MAG TPA: ABC transporter substrate-binding protein, partial [Casimicrobiaceae bacterium]|nr:ABC transporter substrate-binding protein [Casimicrobiaceae bacterium]